jgi:hypothetical protein
MSLLDCSDPPDSAVTPRDGLEWQADEPQPSTLHGAVLTSVRWAEAGRCRPPDPEFGVPAVSALHSRRAGTDRRHHGYTSGRNIAGASGDVANGPRLVVLSARCASDRARKPLLDPELAFMCLHNRHPAPPATVPVVRAILLVYRPDRWSASAPRPAERNRSETRPGWTAQAGAQNPRFRRSDGVWQDQDSNLGRRKPAILQCARPLPFESLPIPTWPRVSGVSCTNSQLTVPTVTPRPRPLRPVPRGRASAGAKMERNSAAVRPNSTPE